MHIDFRGKATYNKDDTVKDSIYMEESMDNNNQMNGNNGNNNNNNGGDNKNNKNGSMFLAFLVISLLALFFMSYVNRQVEGMSSEEISYSKFLELVGEDKVKSVEISSTQIEITMKDSEKETEEENQSKSENNTTSLMPQTGKSKITYYTGIVDDPDLLPLLKEHDVVVKGTIPDNTSVWIYNILSFVIPLVLVWVLFAFIAKRMGGGGVLGVGKSNAKVYVGEQTGKTFKDVAGQEEAKENLQEIVDFLNNPAKYKEIGAKMPKGALLVGPPGTGKTLLAKAVAGEAGVPFFSISGSEFVEMFVGRGAAKVRDLFKQAREKAPCIVFIDEIDTIGKKRDGAGMNGNDEREQTLNQLLAEMDGFDGSKGVVLLAATNRPDSLDPALTRPGRFDRRIPVELPDLAGREAILKLHAKDIKCSNNIDFNVIARASAGASGAELANIINEGALLAVRDHRKTVVQKDLEEAIEIVIAGEQKKGAVISNRERMIVSYHEIGHALVAAKCKNTAPVHKITIIPRTKGALGYTMQVEENEQNLLSKEEAFQKIMVYTGGRCAEELIFNSITSGASNDIEQATKLARAMITRLGMSDEFGMTALETVNNQYLGGDTSLACSNETATKIDEATIALIKKAHDEAYQILEDNKMKLHELAKFLYERETITGEEFMYILNKPAEIPAQTNKD